MEKVTKIPTVFDTTTQQVGEVYARALLGVGQSQGRAAELLEELAAFDDCLKQLPRLAQALEAPRVPESDKVKMLQKALEGKTSKDFLNFLLVLVKRERFNALPAIRQAAGKLFDEITGQVKATVTTASPLSEVAQSKLAERLGKLLGKQVRIETKHDDSIIGGVVVRIGDTVYDASVVNQLNQVRAKTAARIADSIRGSLERFASDVG
jgi:F-type H+-transporting ATPase subunit delta